MSTFDRGIELRSGVGTTPVGGADDDDVTSGLAISTLSSSFCKFVSAIWRFTLTALCLAVIVIVENVLTVSAMRH